MPIVLLLSKARKPVSKLGTPLHWEDEKLMKSMCQMFIMLFNALLESVGSMFSIFF